MMSEFTRVSTRVGDVLTVLGSHMYLGGILGGVDDTYRSLDGISWDNIGGLKGVTAMITRGGFVYAAKDVDATMQRTSATTWATTNPTGLKFVKSFAEFGAHIYAGGTNVDVAGQRELIIRSTSGTSWSSVANNTDFGGFSRHVYDMREFNGELYALVAKFTGGTNTKVFRSPDGTTWTEVLSIDDERNSLAILGDTIYVLGQFGTPIHESTTGDLGDWTNTGVSLDTYRRTARTIDNRVWAGGYSVQDAGYFTAGPTVVQVTFDVDPGFSIKSYVDFNGFVYAVSSTAGVYKGPASTGFKITTDVRLPVLQDFDWQPPVTAIQDTPPV